MFVFCIFIFTRSKRWWKCAVTTECILTILIICIVNNVLFTLLAWKIPMRLLSFAWLCRRTILPTVECPTVLAVLIVSVSCIRWCVAIRSVWSLLCWPLDSYVSFGCDGVWYSEPLLYWMYTIYSLDMLVCSSLEHEIFYDIGLRTHTYPSDMLVYSTPNYWFLFRIGRGHRTYPLDLDI